MVKTITKCKIFFFFEQEVCLINIESTDINRYIENIINNNAC